MSARRLLGALLTVSIALAASPAWGQQQVNIDLSSPEARERSAQDLKAASDADKGEAEAVARQNGWPIRTEVDGQIMELMAIKDGRPLYNITTNENAAISTATDLIRNTSPFNLNGDGLIVGEWDGGDVRASHQEFGARVTDMDGATGISDHSTHVAGTIGAAGVDTSALGMAPSVYIDAYDWTSDTSEATAAAANGAGDPDKIFVSNHSYVVACGWTWCTWSGYGPYWHFYDDIRNAPDLEDPWFGQYNSSPQSWDDLAYQAQYYLSVWSAGNDRTDDPIEGEWVFYVDWSIPAWAYKQYDPAGGDTKGDGIVNGGYDLLGPHACAKNVLTVGAVDDAVSGGLRDLGSATMSTFSSWGPTDDGRVKPDVVGNGVSLYSSTGGDDAEYDSYSGTSMAAPNVAGTAILLVDHYNEQFPGQAMRSSTLKGLLIHTTDDLGNSGPDYGYGWGLVNASHAAYLISEAEDEPDVPAIREGMLDGSTPTETYTLVSDGSTPVRVTLCWTDPAGTATTAWDDTTPRLVNDLDLRLIGPGGLSTFYPYVLDLYNPGNVATTGDNVRDNVEQIYIASPDAVAYTIQVSHKGSLTNGHQHYSVVSSGGVPPPRYAGPPWEYTYELEINGDVTITDTVPSRDGVTTVLAGTPVAIFDNVQYNFLVGTNGDDDIRGIGTIEDDLMCLHNADLILGFAGNDLLRGINGDDAVFGGAGNDRLWGDNDNDVLVGGDGNDILYTGSGNDTVDGGAGADLVVLADADDANDSVDGGPDLGDKLLLANGYGSFTMTGQQNFESFVGGDGDDSIDWSAAAASLNMRGNSGDDTLLGGAGNDIVYTGSGNDTVDGGAGNDLVVLFADGADSVNGGAGAGDRLLLENGYGSFTMTDPQGFEQFIGGDGDDSIDWSAATTRVVLRGNAGNDELTGGSGNDLLTGGPGNDALDGGDGPDTFYGEGGDDKMRGGGGNDRVNGGSGSNSAYFSAEPIPPRYSVRDAGSYTVVKDTTGPDGMDIVRDCGTLAPPPAW